MKSGYRFQKWGKDGRGRGETDMGIGVCFGMDKLETPIKRLEIGGMFSSLPRSFY